MPYSAHAQSARTLPMRMSRTFLQSSLRACLTIDLLVVATHVRFNVFYTTACLFLLKLAQGTACPCKPPRFSPKHRFSSSPRFEGHVLPFTHFALSSQCTCTPTEREQELPSGGRRAVSANSTPCSSRRGDGGCGGASALVASQRTELAQTNSLRRYGSTTVKATL
eukprot:6190401-Pleurochrysis_carterae.AAC.1